MKQALLALVLAATLLAVPGSVSAANTDQPSEESKAIKVIAAALQQQEKTVVAKKPAVIKKTIVKRAATKSVVTCVRCLSLAEGADKSVASKNLEWTGTVIGLNEGARSVIITETTKLNRIKAFAQRNVEINDDTKIATTDGDEKIFTEMDIGYRIVVKGSYDPKTRTVEASEIEIIDVPDAPVTKTK